MKLIDGDYGCGGPHLIHRDVDKLSKIAALIGERLREECGEDEFLRRLCDIVGVVLE